MNQIIKTWIVVFLVGLLSCGANAQDVYNFYFQKSPKKKEVEEKPLVEAEDEELEELQEEMMEVDQDVLLVPDHWKPHQKRYKKVYVRKKQPVTQVVEKYEEPKEKDPYRGWQASLGIGQMTIGDADFGFVGEVTQKTYVIGATYHMSKYFQVNSGVHLPNGEIEGDSFAQFYYGQTSLDPQVNIGLGATPIHLKVFGGEFLQIGVDGGVSFGNGERMADGTGRVYLGPRVAMNFGRHFSLQYTYKSALNSDNNFDMSSLAMAYRW